MTQHTVQFIFLFISFLDVSSDEIDEAATSGTEYIIPEDIPVYNDVNHEIVSNNIPITKYIVELIFFVCVGVHNWTSCMLKCWRMLI